MINVFHRIRPIIKIYIIKILSGSSGKISGSTLRETVRKCVEADPKFLKAIADETTIVNGYNNGSFVSVFVQELKRLVNEGYVTNYMTGEDFFSCHFSMSISQRWDYYWTNTIWDIALQEETFR